MNVGNVTEPWRTHYAHPCAWDQQFAPMAMTELFADSVAAHPDRALSDFYGRTTSYAKVMAEARAFAAGLQARGVVKGDRVGLVLPKVPDSLAAYFGALIAGA